MSQEEATRVCIEPLHCLVAGPFSDDHLSTPKIDGSFDAVKLLINKYKPENVYIVSTSSVPQEKMTKEWLHHHKFFDETGFDEENMLFCRKKKYKAILVQLYKFDYVVESCGLSVNKMIGLVSNGEDTTQSKPEAPEKKSAKKRTKLPSRLAWEKGYSMRDVMEYRKGYPGMHDPPLKDADKNLKFYMNKIPSIPDGDYIDNIHAKWAKNYSKLEVHHGFIQWLFPIREHGLNMHAQPLTTFEAAKMRANPRIMDRVWRSYEVMLDFYGMKLDRETGQVSRGPSWVKQYKNLNTSSHNYLRITRILKFLGEMGLERLQAPLCKHVLEEIYENGCLKNCETSCVKFWIQVVKNDDDRRELEDMVKKHYGVEEGGEEEEDDAKGRRAETDDRDKKRAKRGDDDSDDEEDEGETEVAFKVSKLLWFAPQKEHLKTLDEDAKAKVNLINDWQHLLEHLGFANTTA